MYDTDAKCATCGEVNSTDDCDAAGPRCRFCDRSLYGSEPDDRRRRSLRSRRCRQRLRRLRDGSGVLCDEYQR